MQKFHEFFFFWGGLAYLNLFFSAIFYKTKMFLGSFEGKIPAAPYFYLYFTSLSPKEHFNYNPTHVKILESSDSSQFPPCQSSNF